ncbi:sensor histidine kinase [Acididesulfobacillus acetoxydans]|uniref:sensor histidine kinase n=1 Tax=Acididesulfobacillus acetoxydans TaxID=1561005 RepID=UPI001F0E4AD7|nr:hypothetical protein [Acididesulfobacillus acetoxydans]
MPVPGLILQPLAENDFIHSMKNVTHKGPLKVRVGKEGEWTRVEVGENGQGISENRLKECG